MDDWNEQLSSSEVTKHVFCAGQERLPDQPLEIIPVVPVDERQVPLTVWLCLVVVHVNAGERG